MPLQPVGRWASPYRFLIRPSLRFIDSEKAHNLTVNALTKMAENRPTQKILNSIYGTPNLPITVFGKLFRHPLGLAAGFDKSAQAIGAWLRTWIFLGRVWWGDTLPSGRKCKT